MYQTTCDTNKFDARPQESSLSIAIADDYPVLLAYTLVGAVFVVLGNFVADIALTVADPRIRLA